MNIVFTGRRKTVAASRVAFEASTEGESIWCSVSLDALSDHFGLDGTSSSDLLRSFEANRVAIENAARRVLERGGAHSVELETNDFN